MSILTRLCLQEEAVDGAGGAGHVGQGDLPQESIGTRHMKDAGQTNNHLEEKATLRFFCTLQRGRGRLSSGNAPD